MLAPGRWAVTSSTAVAVERGSRPQESPNQQARQCLGCQARPGGSIGGAGVLTCHQEVPCILEGAAPLAPHAHTREDPFLSSCFRSRPHPLVLTTLFLPQWRAFLPGLKFEVIGSAHISLYTGAEPSTSLGRGWAPNGGGLFEMGLDVGGEG